MGHVIMVLHVGKNALSIVPAIGCPYLYIILLTGKMFLFLSQELQNNIHLNRHRFHYKASIKEQCDSQTGKED